MPNIELTSSQEDYLETIYHTISEKQAARAKDIVREMGVKAPIRKSPNHSLQRHVYRLSDREIDDLTYACNICILEPADLMGSQGA